MDGVSKNSIRQPAAMATVSISTFRICCIQPGNVLHWMVSFNWPPRRPPGGIQQDYDCGFCSALPWRDETLSLEIFNLPGERFNGIMAAAAILAFVCLLLSDR